MCHRCRNDNIGFVVLVRRLKERDCYDLLRDECGFTHYGVRVVARRYMWSDRWRRALEKEKQQFKIDNGDEIEAIALRCLDLTLWIQGERYWLSHGIIQSNRLRFVGRLAWRSLRRLAGLWNTIRNRNKRFGNLWINFANTRSESWKNDGLKT